MYAPPGELLDTLFSPSAPSQSAASDPASKAKLKLEDALVIAFAANPTFEEFRANVAVARAEVLDAMLYRNPEVEGAFGFSRGREEPRDTEPEFGVAISQPIEWPATRRTRREAAELLEPVVVAEALEFRNELRARVQMAYYTVRFRQDWLALAEETQRTSDEIDQVVRRRFESGEAPEIDRVKARVEALSARRDVTAQKRALASSRAVLIALCGGELPIEFFAADSLPESYQPLHGSQAVAVAIERHPEMQRLTAEFDQAKAALSREKASWYPAITPGIELGRESEEDVGAMTLGFEVPLFNRNHGGIARAEAEIEKIQARIASAAIRIEGQLNTTAEDYSRGREQIAAFDEGIREAAAEALRIEFFLYEQGETDFLQLLDARRTARQTEFDYLQVLYDAALARVELEQAIGLGGQP